MKAPSHHSPKGPGKAQPAPTPVQIELMAQKAELERIIESPEVQKPRRPRWLASHRPKSPSEAPAPKSRGRAKPKSRNRKAVLAAYKSERGIG
jgi:hypothetical protein